MDFLQIAFLGFSLVALASGLAVVTVKNPVHAALFLVLTFFTVACVWLLAEAEFLAVVLVLVYVGAVMVLFLFVVMMLDIDTVSLREGFARYLPVAAVVAVVMAVEMVMLLGTRRFGQRFGAEDPAAAAGVGNTEWVGRALFTDYVVPFEIAAVILTVAIVVAIALTLRRRPGTKYQDPARQVRVRREERVRIIKMAAEVREEEPR